MIRKKLRRTGKMPSPPPFRPQGVRLGRDCQTKHFILGQRLALRRLEAEAVQHPGQVEPDGGLGEASPRTAPVARAKRYEIVAGQRGGR